MVEGKMVKDILTDNMVMDGEQLVKKLLDTDLNIRAAFWLYLKESDKWRLMIATPKVGADGPISVYKKLQSILKEFDKETLNFTLSDLSVVKPNNEVVQLLKGVFGPTDGVKQIRFSKNAINTHYIEDSLLYYLD